MDTLYSRTGNQDQNALALHFFEVGYHLWRLLEVVHQRKQKEEVERLLVRTRESLNWLKKYATLPDSRAQIAANQIGVHLDKAHQAGLSFAGLESTLGIARSATSLSGDGSDPARAWFLVGLYAAAADLCTASPQPKELFHDADKELLDCLGPIIRCSAAVRLLNQVQHLKHSRFDSISGWLRAHGSKLWEPVQSPRVNPRFNRREIQDVEYKVLVAARTYAYGEGAAGLSVKELEALTKNPSSANALSKLRKYPETRPFLSPRGKLKFIGIAPEPPANSPMLKK